MFFTLERSELQDVWKRLFHNFPIVQFFHNVLLPELPQVPTAIPAPVPNEVDGDILLAMPWTSTVSSPLTVGKFVVYLIDDQRIRGYPNKIYSWEDHWRLQPSSTWKGKHVASDFAMSNVFFPFSGAGKKHCQDCGGHGAPMVQWKLVRIIICLKQKPRACPVIWCQLKITNVQPHMHVTSHLNDVSRLGGNNLQHWH